MNANSSKNGVKFHYFYDRNINPKMVSKGHGGIISVMTKLDYNTKTIKISFSYCSPKDIFNKKIAHKICEGRMNAEHFVENPFTGNSFENAAQYWNGKMDAKFKPKFCKGWIINSETGEIFGKRW